MNVTLWLAFIAGFISFLSPCVLPLVPAYIGYMGGRVTNTVAAQTAEGVRMVVQPSLVSRLSTVLHGMAFVAGFTFVFVTLGLLTNVVLLRIVGGQNVALVREIIARVGGLLIIFFGLHFTGIVPALFRRALANTSLLSNRLFSLAFAVIAALVLVWAFVDPLIGLPLTLILLLWLALGGAFTQPAVFWNRTIQSLQALLYADTRRQMVASGQQSYSSSALMGVVFAAGWTPCIGPIYGSILTLAASGDATGQAVMLMMAYSFGLGIPFLLAALLLDSAQAVMRKLQRHLRTIELATGVFLMIIGVLVATGQLQSLSQNFANQFSDFSIRMENCVIGATHGEISLGDVPSCINGTTGETSALPAPGTTGS